MSQAFETYEQFCFALQRNVIVEEHFLSSGQHYIICKHKDKCTVPRCKAISQLTKQMNSMKTFEK